MKETNGERKCKRVAKAITRVKKKRRPKSGREQRER